MATAAESFFYELKIVICYYLLKKKIINILYKIHISNNYILIFVI